MRALLVASVLLAACLDAPPGSIRDGGAGDGAAGDPDAGGISCPGEVELDLDQEADLAGWTPEQGASCSYAITPGGLEFTNTGSESMCRLYTDQLLDMRAGVLAVRLNDADPNLAMSFSVMLGAAELDSLERRWIYFERDQGLLLFGQCIPGLVCDDTIWGSVVYSAASHLWLRFSHDRNTDRLNFETSVNGVDWDFQASAEDVSLEDVYCIGLDLGSYEEQDSGGTTSSSFSNLSGGPPPDLTRP